ncbi:MAG TPA: response regulator transcription factor [Bryobacteraceae bacterium]|nr:response regulator transcription factor [Bryobacteraceae bacterium]
MSRVKILLADDHKIVAEGLERLLTGSFDLVGTVADGRALLEAAGRLKPDVIVTDISMPLVNGLDAIRRLKAETPAIKIVVLTMHADPYLAAQAFKAGASGFLLKRAAGEELIHAIGEIIQDRAYLTPLVAKDTISILMDAKDRGFSDEVKLTPRQRDVLRLVGEGHTMKEVAAALKVSVRIAESCKYELMQVLHVQTVAELIQCAIRLGVIS